MTAQTRWFSLRRRLLATLLGGITAGWLVMLGAAYIDAHHEIDELVRKHTSHPGHEHDHDDDHVRAELTEHIVQRLLAPILFGVPMLGAWIWLATRRALAPIDVLARQIAQRAPGNLARLTPEQAPTEIRPLLDSLNDLLRRVENALDNERRFTADAAHELRTPLAALAAQAQVALRARDADESRNAIEQIFAASRRASRLVDQLLTLARIDPAAGLHKAPVDLCALAADVCADHGAAALAKDIALELETSGAVSVAGNADLLRILMRNLVDNAVRYTPPGGRVLVAVTSAGGPRFVVEDNGPGIPPEERASALHRFHRLAGQASEGSGLGLSIVTRIVELHGATLTLGEGLPGPDGRGLRIGVQLPAA